ncbi:peptide MFS transporter [Glutamicibacter sp. TV12E]|uniref:peptide MFS transporter n=1 Tax=Glutamicibacter sp. TV12E TaxID=3446362 RepID=UPI004033E467
MKETGPSADVGTATIPPPSEAGKMPRGVLALSFVEMWERYSFYGLQGILTLYLIYELNRGGLGLNALEAGGVAGAYGGAVYLSQLVGAWFSERVMPPKLLVLYGAAAITAGHICLAAIPGLNGLGIALGLIILGTGALKTNITAIVGMLYAQRPRSERDAGFSYFFMGISVGSILGPLSTGFAQTQHGFHAGFAVAAVVIGLSLIQYAVLMKHLPAQSAVVARPLGRAGKAAAVTSLLMTIGAVSAALSTGVLALASLTIYASVLTVGAAVVYFALMLRSAKVTAAEHQRVKGYIFVFAGITIFFSLLMQMYTTAPMFIDEFVDASFAGWKVPAAWIIMAGTVASAASAPFLAALWKRLGDRQPSAPAKVSMGIFCVGLGYVALAFASQVYGAVPIPLFIALGCMMVHGASEMLVGPTGLSLATAIGPAAFSSQLVGLSFLNLAIGSTLAGALAQIYSLTTPTGFFSINALAGLIAAGLLFSGRRKISGMLLQGL